jgi:hypothetical protein
MAGSGDKARALAHGGKAAGWQPNRRAKQVGTFVSQLMRPSFEKFGFSASTLLTDWAAIAGPDVAAYTAPERLKWPRGTGRDGEAGGATLVLRVAGARALEVEQMRPRLIERINATFGYRAVSEIRVIQAPLPPRGAPTRPAPARPDPHLLEALPDGPLKPALARMAAGMAARRRAAEPVSA